MYLLLQVALFLWLSSSTSHPCRYRTIYWQSRTITNADNFSFGHRPGSCKLIYVQKESTGQVSIPTKMQPQRLLCMRLSKTPTTLGCQNGIYDQHPIFRFIMSTSGNSTSATNANAGVVRVTLPLHEVWNRVLRWVSKASPPKPTIGAPRHPHSRYQAPV